MKWYRALRHTLPYTELIASSKYGWLGRTLPCLHPEIIHIVSTIQDTKSLRDKIANKFNVSKCKAMQG